MECTNEILAGVSEEVLDMSDMTLPMPYLRDYYRDEEDRIFWLNDVVENCAESLIRMIMQCNKEDKGKPVEERKPIKIFIDSPGGDVTFMWSIINLINISKTPVWTVNYCTAFSAAAEILAAGHKRFAFPGSSAMLHNGGRGYNGTAEQVESMKKYIDKLTKKTTEMLLSKTKIDPKVFKRKAVVDWYLDEYEALENGLIDVIITDFDELF